MISLGIDESYKRIGICVTQGHSVTSGDIIKVKSYNYKGLNNNTLKRKFVKDLIIHAIEKYKPEVIIVERIRLFSQNFISKNYMISTGALIATIVDAAYPQKVYSVDTRSWKSRVIGKSAGNKQVSVDFIKQRYKLKLNDDAADAVCISLYGLEYKKFLSQKLLKIES